jgi:hypothetical protein
MINHIWYVFWNPCVEASLITPFWMMQRWHSWDTQLLCLSLAFLDGAKLF